MFALSFYVALVAAGSAYAAATGRANATITTAVAAVKPSAVALDPNVLNCFITVPNNPLTAAGLATPYILQPPCSMAVATQQAFAEAAIYDSATGKISIYHPLVTNAGVQPAAAPVVPTLPANAVVGLWFGFNGGVLQLLDVNGRDTNASPLLKTAGCVNGLPGKIGDVFGQVSWCNAQPWFTAANAGIAAGLLKISPLGVDKLGNACPTSRSFAITDACPSDNVPTQYILVGNATAQKTTANANALANGEIINNASDEALLANIIDPLIGCTPFLAPSIDNPGEMVPALALAELQAAALQQAPIGLVPLNNPDCLITGAGTVSTDKTNAYRLGVNQPLVGTGDTSGALVPYCNNMVAVAPPFLKGFQSTFITQTTPAANVGNNLFTFMCERYLMSLTQLTCAPPAFQPVVCQVDGNGVATSCVINLNTTTLSSGKATSTPTTAATTKATSVATTKAASVATTKATSVATTKASSVNTTKASSVPTTNASSVATTKATTKATTVLTTALGTGLKTALTASSVVAKFANSTVAHSNTAVAVTTTAKATATTTVVATATQVVTQVVIVEVISFFIFTLSLGGPPPSVLSSGNANTPFVVFEEVFIDLASAASSACAHQLDICIAAANSGGAIFAAVDCQVQQSSCMGAASNAKPAANTPATLTATATVVTPVAAKSITPTVSPTPAAGSAGVIAGTGTGAGSNAKPAGVCFPTATVTMMMQAPVRTVSSCIATQVMMQTVTMTVTATAGFGTASAGWYGNAALHARAHMGGRRGAKRY
jgi:hypothetical protein